MGKEIFGLNRRRPAITRKAVLFGDCWKQLSKKRRPASGLAQDAYVADDKSPSSSARRAHLRDTPA